MSEPNWLAWLKDEVDANGVRPTAELLNVSAATVSLIVRGKYPAKTDRVAARIEAFINGGGNEQQHHD